MTAPLINAAKTALLDCMDLKTTETALIVTDTDTQTIGQALFEVARDNSKEAVLLVMPTRTVNGQEPPQQVAEMMGRFDLVICPTKMSLTHTDARRNACAKGTRVGTMPGISEDIMIRTMQADYLAIAKRTETLSAILDKTDLVRVTTPAGTDINLPIKNINAISSRGLVLDKGSYGNLPSGESFLMPEEGKANGVFVVDASFASVGKIEHAPIRVEVKDGYAVDISGGPEADKLFSVLEPFGKAGRNVAELGIGTNDAAKITGLILEDEKVMGTVHIALGNNVSMGGTCNVGVHVDGVMLKPTVYMDGKMVMQDGKLLIEIG